MIGILTIAAAAAIGAWALLDVATRKDIAELTVRDEPTEVTFQGSDEGVVVLHAVVDVENSSHANAHTDALPHLLDYDIVIEHEGEEVAHLVCNPFKARAFARTTSRGEGRRRYRGRLDDCATHVPSGTLTLRARRVWQSHDDRFRFRDTSLVVTQ